MSNVTIERPPRAAPATTIHREIEQLAAAIAARERISFGEAYRRALAEYQSQEERP